MSEEDNEIKIDITLMAITHHVMRSPLETVASKKIAVHQVHPLHG
jgi:hypothetical protein